MQNHINFKKAFQNIQHFNAITHQPTAACRTLRSRSICHTVACLRIETEKLRADTLILEASVGATITTTLRVQREQCTGQCASQRAILMRCIVQAGGGVAAANNKIDNIMKMVFLH